jgi:glucose/arabinose dehydrogenase
VARRALLVILAVSVAFLGFAIWRDRQTINPADCPAGTELERSVEAKAGPQLRLTEIVQANTLTGMAVRPNDPALYLTEKEGAVRVVRDGVLRPEPLLDLTGQVSLRNEQGLLGLAFSPDGSKLYINYTDLQGDTRIAEYAYAEPVDPATRRELIYNDKESVDHNGGDLNFGPDGMLYISLGDGGPVLDPKDRGQSRNDLFGNILRIDPRPDGDKPYRIPPGNPFAHTAGARAELWAFGLRNPWQFSFDPETGDIWIGDVGQFCIEEIDIIPAGTAGQNFGWSEMEGTRRLESRPDGAVPPVYEYSHSTGGCSVTGGFVSRNPRLPEIEGLYVFGDFCTGKIRGLRMVDGEAAELLDLADFPGNIFSFGEDNEGNLYALGNKGRVYRLDPPAG